VVIPSIFAFAMLVRSMNVTMKRSMRGGRILRSHFRVIRLSSAGSSINSSEESSVDEGSLYFSFMVVWPSSAELICEDILLRRVGRYWGARKFKQKLRRATVELKE